MNEFPNSLLDELRRVFSSTPRTVYEAPDTKLPSVPVRLPLQSIRFRPGTKRSVVEVVLGDDTMDPLTVLIFAGDYESAYKVPASGKLSSLAWVISIRAEEQIFSRPRSELSDVVNLR